MEYPEKEDTQPWYSGLDHLAEALPKYRQLYDRLLWEISTGKLKPGDRIPSEKELCALSGVSRITSKKALDMLVENQLVTRQRGKGSFITGMPVELAVSRQNAASFRSIAFIMSSFNDPFGTKLVWSVEEACAALGYHLILKLTHESPTAEEKALRALDDENVPGILMIPVRSEHYNAEILRRILNKRPLVFVDRKMRGLSVPSVSTDCVAATETAVKRLLEKGHRNIAFYSGPVIHTSTVEERRLGFVKALTENGVQLNPAYICDNLPSPYDFNTIARHLETHPELTAAFTSEFGLAMLVKRALAEHGRLIPRDFALVTFDRPDYAIEFPGIACLRQDEDAIGKRAVEILDHIIRGEAVRDAGEVMIPAELVPAKEYKPKLRYLNQAGK